MADTYHTRGIVVIGTSESGARKVRLIDRYHVVRTDDPAPEVGFPPSKPGPVRIETTPADDKKGNHWVSRQEVEIL